MDGQLILSNGWLSTWKGRHGVFSVRLHGEAGGADQQGVARAQRELPGIIEKYRPEDVFNIDETGLFYRQAVSDLIKATCTYIAHLYMTVHMTSLLGTCT